MLENNNNLETLYKNKFEDFRVEPSSKVWENIEKNISTTKVTNFNYLKFGSYLLVTVAIVAVATYYLTQNNSETVNILPLLKSNFIKNEIRSSSPKTEIKKEIKTFSTVVLNSQKANNLSTNQVISTQNNNVSTETKYIEGISNVLFFNIKKDETSESNTNDKTKESKNLKFTKSASTGCMPLNIKFKNTVENAKNIVWNFGDGTTSNLENTEYTYTEAGTYYVSLQYELNNETLQIYDTVEVKQTPEADFSANKTSGLMSDEEIDFQNNSINAENYLWIFGDSNYSTDYEPNYKYKNIGEYQVKLLAKAGNDCKDSVTKTIKVEVSKYNIVFPNAFYPNLSGPSGGIYSRTINKTDIFYPIVANEIDEYTLNIYNKTNSLIFHTDRLDVGWDGYFDNKIVETGVYIYEVNGKYTNGENFKKQGSVTLLKK